MTNLSPRELEVAKHVANGLEDKTIAAILECSPRTVQTHLDRIAHKLKIDPGGIARRRAIGEWFRKVA